MQITKACLQKTVVARAAAAVTTAISSKRDNNSSSDNEGEDDREGGAECEQADRSHTSWLCTKGAVVAITSAGDPNVELLKLLMRYSSVGLPLLIHVFCSWNVSCWLHLHRP
jgi:hypothetical protein